jgi:glycosyltransferase involved in cell wall biosynthesis
MKFAYIGTYPPRQCGIGTFTNNLRTSMLNSITEENLHEGFVVAMTHTEEYDGYPDEVKLKIRQEYQRDYLEAAKFINLSGADVCILEHEFGIFGGQNGVYILPLLHRLEVPLIVTLHTILKRPSYNEMAVLQEICKMANRVVVMSNRAVDFLINIYKVPKNKVKLVQHGVPDILFDQMQSKKEYKLEKKKVILTFGLIGRNKGIETVINSLPEVVAKHPDVLYIVLGKTHPNVLKYSGEEYRVFLMKLVKKHELENHVLFLNEFIDEEVLFKYLSACDIYVTPYLNEAQITSGTLSYAVGAGTAVISTRYWHAEELLAEGRGVLFGFGDHDELTSILLNLLDQPDELQHLRKNAYKYGRKITWPIIGNMYADICEKLVKERPKIMKRKEISIDPLLLPEFSLLHLKRLTDDTGIIQHAKFGIPNLKDGYCLDDNARALLTILMVFKQKKDYKALELCPVYLSFIHYMQNKDGNFRNFLSFKRDYLDEQGSEDSFGRTIWALGYLMGNAPNDAYFQSARQIFFDALPNFEKLESIRGIANTVIGICNYLYGSPGDEGMIRILIRMTDKLLEHYKLNESENWKWFESMLAYDNAVLPLSLLHAFRILKKKNIKKAAFESLDFLMEHTFKEGYLSVIGNEQWFRKDSIRSTFAQQPVDVSAMVLMFHQAWILTKEKKFLDHLYTCFMWFLGENDMRMNLYDFETNGCCDGLESYGLNRNQGAESTLAYLIAYLTVLEAFGDFHEN